MKKTFKQLKKGDNIYRFNPETGRVYVSAIDRITSFEITIDISEEQRRSLFRSIDAADVDSYKYREKWIRTYDDYHEDVELSEIYYSDKEECINDVKAFFEHQNKLRSLALKNLRYEKNYKIDKRFKFENVTIETR